MKSKITILYFLITCFFQGLYSCDTLADPYSHVKSLLPFNDFGWYYAEIPMEKTIREKKAKIVIELGSWLGKSTRHIASLLPEDGRVYAVDHWEGSKEHQKEFKEYLPTLYEQFLSNVIHAKLTHKIIPIRMSTQDAACLFKEKKIIPDIVYVDASHDEGSVYQDLAAYYPLVKGHGTLIGDDWGWGEEENYPVKRAVLRFAKEHNLKIDLYYSDWVWMLSEKE